MSETSDAGAALGERFSGGHQVKLLGEGILTGVVGGGVVTLYRLALTQAESLLRGCTEAASANPLLVCGWFVVVGVLCVAVSFLMRWEPYTQGSGIPQTDAEVMGMMDMPWKRVLPVKFCEGVLGALAGLSLGREGPSVQLGAMSGKAVSRTLGRSRSEERLLVTCGAAAGMSAAFNAPFTGVLFALEEIHREFTPSLIIAAMGSSVAADFLVSQVLGVDPVLKFSLAHQLPHIQYFYVVALGIFCGLMGWVHNAGMFACQERLFARIGRGAPLSRISVAFGLAGVMAFVAPVFTCGGDAILEEIVDPQMVPAETVAALLVGKYLFTTVCFGSGAPGGTLFPLVILGALSGILFGHGVVGALGLPEDYLVNFAVLGIAGLFSGVIRAPVTAVVLCFELTGTLDVLLSVSIVSLVAYVVANTLGSDPYYEHLLSNLLDVPGESVRDAGFSGKKVLKTYAVGTGSFVENKRIREIRWPAGVLIVEIVRAGNEIVPSGTTRIRALDEMLVIMDAGTQDDAQIILSHYCKGSLASRVTPMTGRSRMR